MRHLTAIIVGAVLLQGCSYIYDLRAVVIDGRLAFISAEDRYSCIAVINVTAEDGTRAAPTGSDDQGLVTNGGAFWWTEGPVMDCRANFPVFYGALPSGTRTLVSPKPLRAGVIYAVRTSGEGANGSGCFRILSDRRVENLASSHCYPPRRDDGNES